METHELVFRKYAHKTIAYFCAEYGIEDTLPIFAGGLGILAGDFIMEAGEQGLPVVGIGLFYHHGFPVWTGKESLQPKKLNPEASGYTLLHDKHNALVKIPIEIDSRIVTAQAWVTNYGSARLFLLDTDVEPNRPEDRSITQYLYESRFELKMLQELVLGIGGVKLLRTLGIEPDIYHLNEGHTSFALLALMVEYLHDHPEETSLTTALEKISGNVVATKHTILTEAGIYFSHDQFQKIIAAYLKRHRANFEEFFEFGKTDRDPLLFSTTKFLLRGACRENGVSMLHAVFEKQKHPHSELIPITNGVNIARWRAGAWPKAGIGAQSDAELWKTKNRLRSELLDFIQATAGIRMNPDALTVVWARRFAAYKRPQIIFNDLKRLEALVANANRPIQFIISGRANEADSEGRELIKKIINYTAEKRFAGKIVYLPDYTSGAARKLVAGADVWLNTPIRGKEACATSGMKAGLNGALQYSISDGWIEEVDWSLKGWILPDTDTEQKLYDIFESEIIPTFYERNSDGLPEQWLKRIRGTISTVMERYSAECMLAHYYEKLYFPGR